MASVEAGVKSQMELQVGHPTRPRFELHFDPRWGAPERDSRCAGPPFVGGLNFDPRRGAPERIGGSYHRKLLHQALGQRLSQGDFRNYSISHCRGLGGFVLSEPDHCVGLDIEPLHRSVDWSALAKVSRPDKLRQADASWQANKLRPPVELQPHGKLRLTAELLAARVAHNRPLFLWLAKEASFKALRRVCAPRLLSQVQVGGWWRGDGDAIVSDVSILWPTLWHFNFACPAAKGQDAKGQYVKGQDVKGQEVKDQDIKGQGYIAINGDYAFALSWLKSLSLSLSL